LLNALAIPAPIAVRRRQPMPLEATSRMVHVSGQGTLLDRFRDPLERALGTRRSYYHVSLEAVGRVGEVLVSVTGNKGRLPMLFGSEDLDPGYVTRVVVDTLARYGL
jgi:hypothetical protein